MGPRSPRMAPAATCRRGRPAPRTARPIAAAGIRRHRSLVAPPLGDSRPQRAPAASLSGASLYSTTAVDNARLSRSLVIDYICLSPRFGLTINSCNLRANGPPEDGDCARRRTMSRVLVVDDDQGMRNVVKTVLERRGHDVTAAEDGRSAITA